MPIVQALDSFDHNGRRHRGQRFPASAPEARKLRDAGLVAIVGEADKLHPTPAAGTPSSASRAAQASLQTTAKPSGDGEKPRRRKKAAASS